MITPNSITDVKGLEDRPVYFLKLNNSPDWNLVVKMDAKNRAETDTTNDAAVSIKWGSKLMKSVNDEKVNTKIMTQPEIDVFKAVARLKFREGTPQRLNTTQIGPVWVKMPYVRGLTDADMWNDKVKKNEITVIRALLAKFADEAVWTALGKVVAVDIFIGNNDRFDTTGHWVNKGNIMFQDGANTSPVIGLDTYDYNSQTSNLNTGGGFDELRILTDAGRRHAFATACAQSVGKQFASAMLKAGARSFHLSTEGEIKILNADDKDKGKTWFEAYAANFEEGFTAGAEQLKQTLQEKYRRYTAWTTPQFNPPQQQARQGFLGNARPMVQQPGFVPMRPVPVHQDPHKHFPQGILDRMIFLGWKPFGPQY